MEPVILLRAVMIVKLAAGAAGAEAPRVERLLEALKPEMTRNLAGLLLPGQPAPYYAAFSLVDYRNLGIRARFGDIVENEISDGRYLQVRMRVGSTELDNSNFIGYGINASQGAVRQMSREDDPGPLVRDAWLACDSAYKRSVEALSAKVAALKQDQNTDRPPDFSPAAPVEAWEEEAEFGEDCREKLAETARRLSAVFRDCPQAQRADVDIDLVCNTARFMDTDGFRHRVPLKMVRIVVSAEAQTDEGVPLREVLAVMAPDAESLPPLSQMVDSVRRVAERLSERASRASELDGPYLGPVLFGPEAAAEMLRQTFAADISGTPSPVTGSDYLKDAVRSGQLARFMGLRVFPEWIDVTDDPGIMEWEGRALAGHYRVDREGVPGLKVSVVRDGRLRAFLMSRTPSKEMPSSNGHGRMVTGHMVKAAPSNVIVRARKTESEKDLLKRLRKMARAEGLSYGIFVRHIDEPSAAGSPRRISMRIGDEEAEEAPSRWGLSPALDVVKVDVATGKETRLRGALFGPVGIAELRGIAAVGDSYGVYSVVMEPETSDFWQGHSENTPVSIVSPALIFSSLEVRPPGKRKRPLPIIESPFALRGLP